MDIDRDFLKALGDVRTVISSGFFAIPRIKWHTLFSDIVISWFASTYTALLVFMAKKLGKMSIVIVGGADVDVDSELGYGLLNSRWKEKIVGYAIRNATHVLPVSKYLEDRTRQAGHYDGNNIRRVPPGIDGDFWRPAGRKETEVLTVAACPTPNRIQIKGIDILIRAALALTEVHFLVIGISPYVLGKTFGDIPPNVTVKPPMDEKELLPYYQKARVCCQPSRIESFSFTLAQGMLCECIPVGTNVGGIPEVMGGLGFGVPPGNSDALAIGLQEALNSDAVTGKAARKHIQTEFPLSRRAEELQRLIIE